MCGFIVIQSQLPQGHFCEDLAAIQHRGPDNSRWQTLRIATKPINWRLAYNRHFGFNRLAIMDTSRAGDQPFALEDRQGNDWLLVANGEIYNYKLLGDKMGIHLDSGSDCEILLPLMQRYGLKVAADLLDGEFALVLHNGATGQLWAARDHLGIRPLFYGRDQEGRLQFASEAKALMRFCQSIKPFPPGHVFNGTTIEPFTDSSRVEGPYHLDETTIKEAIRTKLTSAVIKRLEADRPIGFLLSGGLDSSLVCAIAARWQRQRGLPPIKTFAIGNDTDAIDLRYARIAADYIGAEHTEFTFSQEQVIEALPKVIYHLESWDTTTVRASLGMYLLVQAIRQHSSIKVLLTGETSDELFGYKYTDFAPSDDAFQQEAAKRIRELYLYDGLRADRCIAAHGLEARVPFSDKDFVRYVMAIHPSLKRNLPRGEQTIGKRLLRYAFAPSAGKDKLLPDSILLREKAAFSDGVGHSMVDWLKDYAQSLYSDEQLAKATGSPFSPPSKEALLYQEIFFQQFPRALGSAGWIPSYWLPNSSWPNCAVTDPSARVLPNYGSSGA